MILAPYIGVDVSPIIDGDDPVLPGFLQARIQWVEEMLNADD